MEINNFPDEILEHIFIHLSPCRDYKCAMLVCRRWYRVIKDVAFLVRRNFLDSFENDSLLWSQMFVSSEPTISERYSHSACFHDKIMYIFGGCTAMNTTFNDLWGFNVCLGKWNRCLASGAYPSPKAYASLVSYKDMLILFGGWSYPTPYPLHQAAKFFNELHTYMPATSRWECIVTTSSPPPMAGQGASVIGDSMIVYGGCVGQSLGLSDVWVLDLLLMDWSKVDMCSEIVPSTRYGHCQAVLDDNHILVLGGCGGPNKVLCDAWMLTIQEGNNWSWSPLSYIGDNQENITRLIWCHPCCKVGDTVIFLSRGQKSVVREQFPNGKQQTAERYKPCVQPDSSSDSDDSSIPKSRAQKVLSQASNQNGTQMSELSRADPELSFNSNSRSSNLEVAPPTFPCDVGNHEVNELHFNDDNNLLGLGKTRSNINNGMTNNYAESLPSRSVNDDNCFNLSAPSSSNSSQTVPHSGNFSHNFSSSSATSNSNRFSSDEPRSTTSINSISLKSGTSAPAPGPPSIRPNARKNRQKQLEALRAYEQRLRERTAASSSSNQMHQTNPGIESNGNTRIVQPMCIHRLNIGNVLTANTISWLPSITHDVQNAPEERLFYSLVEGWGELLLFGGIRSDSHSAQLGRTTQTAQTASHNVYFLRAAFRH